MFICTCMHEKTITQMTSPLASLDLNTIYIPDIKWRPDVVS